MNATLKQIANESLQLSPAQRAELAGFLVESLESTPPDDIQNLWFQEANRRLSEVRDGTVNTIPGQQVLAEARRMTQR